MTPSALFRLAHAFQKSAQDFGDFEPYVYEDDPSIGYYEDAMNSYMDEWEGAIWDDLKQEQKRLKDTAAEFSMDNQEPPHILKKQLDFINKQLQTRF